jgi:RsiW-degrading membrane proteinase PrsW (M82 family)
MTPSGSPFTGTARISGTLASANSANSANSPYTAGADANASACELILTHSDQHFPEALREAALGHLSQATGTSVEQLQRLLQKPRPVIAVTADEGAARQLQAALQRGGWQSELRRLAGPAQPNVKCRTCQLNNPATSRFCAQCGTSLSNNNGLPSLAPPAPGMVSAAASTLANVVGLQGIQRFNLGELLAEVFKRRTPNEIEEHFLVGTLRTTPPVTEIPTDWPKPWLFARMFLASILVFVLMYIPWHFYQNVNLIPGMIIVGCVVTPMSALLLLYEFNAPRNISWMLVIRLVTTGGAMSLLISLVLFKLSPELRTLLQASAAGLVEETGKLAAVVFATRKLSVVRYRYTLNGLVFGAAVGTGFAVFESAGYAFTALLAKGQADQMFANILTRGMLSPFCHVIWTALTAAALWRVKGAHSYSGTLLADWRFLRIFFVSVACHVVWNAPFWPPYHLKELALGFIAWAVALSLVQDGLRQVQNEQRSLV